MTDDARIARLVEEWREIVGFAGYEVSSLGRIRSWWHPKARPRRRAPEPRPLKPHAAHAGYLHVFMTDSAGQKQRRAVARLVATAFHGTCPVGMECAHNDGICTNNRATNLRWASKRDNARDRELHGTQARGSRNGHARLTEMDIARIRAATGKQEDIARVFGLAQSTVSQIRSHRRWRHVS